MHRLEVVGLDLPLVKPGDDIAKLVVDAAHRLGIEIEDGDVVAVSSKIVSKALGSIVRLDDVEPSDEAKRIASIVNEDARFIELVLRESDRVVAVIPMRELVERGVIKLENMAKDIDTARKVIERFPVLFLVFREGSLWTDAGLDSSNLPDNYIAIPPRNLDEIAKSIRERIHELTGKTVAVVICDTEGFLGGSIDIARGSYGIEPRDRCFAEPDLYGKPKYGGVDIVVHEICAAMALVSKQTSRGIPAVIIKGLQYEKCECGLRDRMMIDPSRAMEALKLVISWTRKVLGVRTLLRTLLSL